MNQPTRGRRGHRVVLVAGIVVGLIAPSACDRIGADGKPEPPDPSSVMRDVLTRFVQWIWLILARL